MESEVRECLRWNQREVRHVSDRVAPSVASWVRSFSSRNEDSSMEQKEHLGHAPAFN